MELLEQIIDFGLSRGYAEEKSHFRKEVISAFANDIESSFGGPVPDAQVEKYAEEILSQEKAYYVYKLNPKDQMKFRKKHFIKRPI